MKPFTRQLHRDEEGVTLVIVALSLVALFGMIVLVVDVGGLLWKRREMVNGSDSAALAAAQTCSVPLTSDPTDPEAQADNAAIANVSGLNAADGSIVAGGPTCRQPRGYVTVQYSVPQQLFFAPVLGFGKTNPVTTAATAAWGPLGAGNAVPIVLDSGQIQGPCQIPDNVAIGDHCNFWYNNGNFAIGDANWGFLNLDQWNVAKDANCSSAGGAADRKDYILNNFGKDLPLADPGPTYVCSMTGKADSNWQELVDRMNCDPNSATPTYANCPGSVMLMPVNDCAKQVDMDGNVVVCGSGTPDKFAIIGFTSLQLSGVYKGNDPLAIGTPGTASDFKTCSGVPLDLSLAGTRQLNLLAQQTCGATVVDSIPFSAAQSTVMPPVPTTSFGVYYTTGNGNNKVYHAYKGCAVGGTAPACDYTYDPTSFALLWVNNLTRNDGQAKLIDFEWIKNATAGTEGFCGLRVSDANAICLVTTWLGYTTQNAPVGTGPDEGTKGFILCDFTYNSCPAGVKP